MHRFSLDSATLSFQKLTETVRSLAATTLNAIKIGWKGECNPIRMRVAPRNITFSDDDYDFVPLESDLALKELIGLQQGDPKLLIYSIGKQNIRSKIRIISDFLVFFRQE